MNLRISKGHESFSISSEDEGVELANRELEETFSNGMFEDAMSALAHKGYVIEDMDMVEKVYCVNCGGLLVKSNRDGYSFQCFACDQDFTNAEKVCRE